MHWVVRTDSHDRMSLGTKGHTGTQEATALAATFVIGPRGVIEEVDEAACALLGCTPDDLLGLHGSELIPPEMRPATAASLDRMRRGEVTSSEGRLVCKDGTSVGVDVTARPASDGRLVLSIRKRAVT